MLDQEEALQILKEALHETDRPDADFIVELSERSHFWMVKPRTYRDYGTGLGYWAIYRETKEVKALNSQIDPNTWEEMYLDALDPTKVWIIRFDANPPKGIIHLKNLLGIPLGEAKALSDSLHWFGGHRVQLESVQRLLLEKGVGTKIERVTHSLEIKKLREFSHEVIFIEDIVRLILHEESFWWDERTR
ncbi:MAG: hypothetical protein R8G66_26900 [Cytophagales bacterium]|nr:hypothetical protein [Cytophagales bacterium]